MKRVSVKTLTTSNKETIMAKKTEPKLIIISLGQLDATTGDGVSTFARAFTSKEEAAEWLNNDYNEEAD